MEGYTKIDVAEAHICTAVQLFFGDAHPIPIYTLATAAREILTTLGSKLGVSTVLHGFADDKGITLKDAIFKAHQYANFMKHADRDATAVLEGFSDNDLLPILFVACNDFGRITGGMPIEAQVYESWYFATAIPRLQNLQPSRRALIKSCIQSFPIGLRSASRPTQKRMGLDALNQARNDPTLTMEFKRILELPRE